MVQSVSHADTLVVAARDGIYRSKNRGESWRRITPEGDPELKGFHSVAVDPRDADTIYVGTWHLPWKTTDGGEHWKRAASREQGMIDDSDIFSIHIDESNPDTILMSACSGIYRSLNSSEKWTKIQGIPNTSRRTHVIYQHPTHPEMIFAGTTEGLWRSANAGRPDSWARVTSLRQVINAIAIHPDKPNRVYLGTEDFGVFVSNDGGESYEPSNAGFVSRQVRAVLADRTERGRVYAGVVFDATNGGLFVSSDGGMTWQHTMKGIGVRDVYSLYQPEKHPRESTPEPTMVYSGLTTMAGPGHRSNEPKMRTSRPKRSHPVNDGQDVTADLFCGAAEIEERCQPQQDNQADKHRTDVRQTASAETQAQA